MKYENFSKILIKGKLAYVFLALTVLFNSISPVVAKGRYSTHVNSFDAVFYIEKAGNLHVNIDVKEDTSMQIQVKDDKGSVLHRELIHWNLHRFGMSFNCSGLPDGDYKIEIFNGQDSKLKQFSIIKKRVQGLK